MEADERTRYLGHIKDHASKIEAFDTAVLRDRKFADLSFAPLEDRILLVKRVARGLPKISESMPDQIVIETYAGLNQLTIQLDAIASFRLVPEPEEGQPSRPFNAREAHRKVYDAFNSEANALLKNVWPAALQYQIDDEEERAKMALAVETIGKSKAAAEEILKKQTEIDALLEKLRKAALKEGAENYVRTFKALAKGFETASRIWLAVVVALSIVTIVFAYQTFNTADFVGSNGEMAPLSTVVLHVTSRVVILSILLFVIGVAARDYRANRHNQVVNRHRATAIDTFELFTKGTADEQTRNAILVKATEAVFQPVGTGYQSKDAEPAPNSTIVEILRAGPKAG
jgi:uncharacterized membrane protein